MSRGRVLYLTYDGLTDGLGRSQVLPYILGLEEKGWEFDIISFEKSGRFEADRSAIDTLLQGRMVNWHPLTYTAKPPVLSTLYDVWRLGKLARTLHAHRGFCAVHCRSYITSLVGEQLKKDLRVPFIFDMRAFYADERVDGGLWPQSNPLYRIIFNYFKKKERDFLATADYTVTLTEKAREIIHGWDGLPQPLPIEVIPCCADLSHFDYNNVGDVQRNETRLSLGIGKEEKVLLYLGSLGTWYMSEEMLKFYRAMIDSNPEFRFVVLTHDDPAPFLKKASGLGITSNRFVIRSAGRAELPRLLSVADLSVFFIQPRFSKAGSSPTKHGELLGMGIPVVCNSGVGDVDRIVSGTRSGLLVNDFDPASLAEAVAEIPAVLAIPKQRLREAAHEYYSLNEGVARYDRIYGTVCGRQ
jgi:glycosyltransferase involved in cell wall biosynthesis